MNLVAQFGNPFQIVWNTLAAALVLYAVLSISRVPGSAFRHGLRTKIFWSIVAVVVLVAFAGYVVPIGAVWARYAVTMQEQRRRRVMEVGPSTPTPV